MQRLRQLSGAGATYEPLHADAGGPSPVPSRVTREPIPTWQQNACPVEAGSSFPRAEPALRSAIYSERLVVRGARHLQHYWRQDDPPHWEEKKPTARTIAGQSKLHSPLRRRCTRQWLG